MLISLAGHPVELLPQRALYLPDTRSLLIADLHIGKAMHFRKSGMPLPAEATGKDLQVLSQLLEIHTPAEVIFLGDLFHSHQNSEWNALVPFLNDHSGIRFALVPGNHDRFSKQFVSGISLEILPESYPLGPFVLTHAPSEIPIAGKYRLCGHLHPGVVLGGKGRMRATLPCFWFGKQTGVLPAFGNLTGLAAVHPKAGDRVVVIADGVCLDVPTE